MVAVEIEDEDQDHVIVVEGMIVGVEDETIDMGEIEGEETIAEEGMIEEEGETIMNSE